LCVVCICAVCAIVASVGAATACRLMWVTAAYQGTPNAVDLYDSATGTWSTAQLSVGRYNLAATSVGKVAIFAGGFGGNYFFRCLLKNSCGIVAYACGVFVPCALLLLVVALQKLVSSSRSLQVQQYSVLWICTIVLRVHGRLLSSAWGAIILQPHLLGQWPSSRGVLGVIIFSVAC
jgi:hypothetical protein